MSFPDSIRLVRTTSAFWNKAFPLHPDLLPSMGENKNQFSLLLKCCLNLQAKFT